MADISKITLPNGSTYDIKDATARNSINDIKTSISSGIHYIGLTNSDVHDGATTNAIILVRPVIKNGVPSMEVISETPYIPNTGDLVIKDDKEYIYAISETSTTGVWHEFGSTGSLKALAFKDNASARVTPSGTVSKPTFTGTAGTVSVKGNTGDISHYFETQIEGAVATYDSASNRWSDVESEAKHIASGKPFKKIVLNGILDGASAVRYITNGNVSSVTNVGTLPTFDATVNGETLSFNFNQGKLPSTKSVNVVTGLDLVSYSSVSISPFCVIGMFNPVNHSNDITMTGTFTPQGTISQPTFTGNASTVTVK